MVKIYVFKNLYIYRKALCWEQIEDTEKVENSSLGLFLAKFIQEKEGFLLFLNVLPIQTSPGDQDQQLSLGTKSPQMA